MRYFGYLTRALTMLSAFQLIVSVCSMHLWLGWVTLAIILMALIFGASTAGRHMAVEKVEVL